MLIHVLLIISAILKYSHNPQEQSGLPHELGRANYSCSAKSHVGSDITDTNAAEISASLQLTNTLHFNRKESHRDTIKTVS